MCVCVCECVCGVVERCEGRPELVPIWAGLLEPFWGRDCARLGLKHVMHLRCWLRLNDAMLAARCSSS